MRLRGSQYPCTLQYFLVLALLVSPQLKLAYALSTSEVEQQITSYIQDSQIINKVKLLILYTVNATAVSGFNTSQPGSYQLPYNISNGSVGPRGYTTSPPVTQFPCGPALASTFNRSLLSLVGIGYGRQMQSLGAYLLLGPDMNMYRIPFAGRNFESISGEDPYLGTQYIPPLVQGIQSQGVQAQLKHYICYDQEINRFKIDNIVDEQTVREIYLPPFIAGIKEGKAAQVMESYNKLNGVAMANNKLWLQQILKDEIGFDGVVMSDNNAVVDGNLSLKSGLDIELNTFVPQWTVNNILTSYYSKNISLADIDEKVKRILRMGMRFNITPQIKSKRFKQFPQDDPFTNQISLEASRQSIILLQNSIKLLPLDRTVTKKIAVLGRQSSSNPPFGHGSAAVVPIHPVSMFKGIQKLAGKGSQVDLFNTGQVSFKNQPFYVTQDKAQQTGLKVSYYTNDQFQGQPQVVNTEKNINFLLKSRVQNSLGPMSIICEGFLDPTKSSKVSEKFLFEIRANAFNPTFNLQINGQDVKVLGADHNIYGQYQYAQANISTTLLVPIKFKYTHKTGYTYSNLELGFVSNHAPQELSNYDAVVVCVGYDSLTNGEGADSEYGMPFYQDDIILDSLSLNPNTIVVTFFGGSVRTSNWINQTPTYLHAWYPGQYGGQVLGEILFGDVSPSGRLPITFEKDIYDVPAIRNYPWNITSPKSIVYTERLLGGYRGFEKNQKQPLFPFGYGLSYTLFNYSDVTISKSSMIGPMDSLTISLTISNIGQIESAQTIQLYAGKVLPGPQDPIKWLKGFEKVLVPAQKQEKINIKLNAEQLQYYDIILKNYTINETSYYVSVGDSSYNIFKVFVVDYAATKGDLVGVQAAPSHKAGVANVPEMNLPVPVVDQPFQQRKPSQPKSSALYLIDFKCFKLLFVILGLAIILLQH